MLLSAPKVHNATFGSKSAQTSLLAPKLQKWRVLARGQLYPLRPCRDRAGRLRGIPRLPRSLKILQGTPRRSPHWAKTPQDLPRLVKSQDPLYKTFQDNQTINTLPRSPKILQDRPSRANTFPDCKRPSLQDRPRPSNLQARWDCSRFRLHRLALGETAHLRKTRFPFTPMMISPAGFACGGLFFSS